MDSYAKIPLPVAIVGAGLSGQAAHRLLIADGIPAAQITIFDQNPDKGSFSDAATLLRDFIPRTLVVSPGVPLATPWIRDFENSGGRVTSELELACAHLQGESIVAVTGSVGKSTTVSLLGAGAQAFCPDAFVGGNLGIPFASYVADVLEGKRKRTQWAVLELSSFQLELARNLKCAGVVITSLTGNHLERYAGREEYYATKWNLIQSSQGPVVLNERGGDLKDYVSLQKVPAHLKLTWASRDRTSLKAADFDRSKLLGLHNRDNLAVAYALAIACNWPVQALAGMLAFKGLAHRLEFVGRFKDIRFVNDSKATAIDSVLTAIDSLKDQGPLVVLLGGKDKKLPWEELAILKSAPSIKFVFFGACGALAREKSGLAGTTFATLQETLPALKTITSAGDTVLLSPGGTSLDEFKNFEDRGAYFSRTVKELFA